MWKEEQPPEVGCKKGALRHFAKFTGKHLCQSLFFDKVADLSKFLRTTFLTEHLLATFSKVLKKMPDKFQNFSDWCFGIKFCFKCEIFFQLTPGILFIFELACHWLTDTHRRFSCLYDVFSSYICLITMQWRRVSTM